jgi:hypothetical protein
LRGCIPKILDASNDRNSIDLSAPSILEITNLYYCRASVQGKQ